MPLVVTRQATPVAQASFPGLIDAAFQAEGAPLQGIQRMMLSVLASIETARGRSVMNHNVGNISAGPQYEGTVWRPPWFDPVEASQDPKLARLHDAMLKGKAPSAFRSYATIEDGARDFARQLLHTFPEVMRASLVPNAETFRQALAEKYSPDYANPKTTTSLAQLMKEYGITPSALAKAGSSGAGGLVLFAMVWLAWRYLRR